MHTELKKEFKKRQILFLLIPVYITIYIFLVDFREARKIIYELENEDTFKISTEKIDSVSYGGLRGSISIHIKVGGITKKALYSPLGNAIVPSNFGNMDSVMVLNSLHLNEYVFIYEDNLFKKRLIYLIFQILYIVIGILFFNFVRKQHFKVQKMAPYGVDENYNPLPKLKDTLNYNKYD